MKKVIVSIITIILAGKMLFAQQDAMISQYMFNGLFINPAYAGSHQYVSTSLLYRNQWSGYKGAPQTALFAIDGPIENKNMGLGMILMHDRIGVTSMTDISGNYNYQIKAGQGKLALGIKAGISIYSAKLSDLKIWDTDDQIFEEDIRNTVVPKMGFGAYYYTDNWYVGFSAPTLLGYTKHSTFKFDVHDATQLRRHYYLNAGYVIPVGEIVKLKPSVLFKYLPNAPFQADLNFHVMFIDQIWIGAGYRSKESVVGMIEYQANQRFRVGYAFDFNTTPIRNYSHGSHEIMIGYDFGRDFTKVKTPRYF
jgi:type IX secretion system PorP/SprF family membrane protein